MKNIIEINHEEIAVVSGGGIITWLNDNKKAIISTAVLAIATIVLIYICCVGKKSAGLDLLGPNDKLIKSY